MGSSVSYIGSNINRVGERVDTRESYLVRGKTAQGEPVIQVDSDRDYVVSEKDPALVIRTEECGEWKWKPVTDIAQLKQFLERASAKEKKEQLGLWRDAHRWLVFGKKDGIPQSKEVTPMGERWDSLTFHNNETATDSHGRTCAWARHYSRVQARDVKVTLMQTAGGPLAVLEEPQEIGRTEVKYVTVWGINGAGDSLPYETWTKIHQAS
ncbi:MAG: hypothetical protein HYU64_10885 [Armatimonadetes bacterium]|nr:hypothetical protein [Armatimonadota bacterium]